MDLKISMTGGGGGGSLVRLASLGGCSTSEGVGSVISTKQSNLNLHSPLWPITVPHPHVPRMGPEK